MSTVIDISAADQVTTLMVRNIPTRFTSLSLVDILKEYGFDRTFDFFYLPMDFKTKKNCGYAFINFVNREYAMKFIDTFQGLQLKASTSLKSVNIIPSRRQGFWDNISVFESSDLLSSTTHASFFKPLVSLSGDLVPLTDSVFSELMECKNVKMHETIMIHGKSSQRIEAL
jgi:RNA recognition motif-containing protein